VEVLEEVRADRVTPENLEEGPVEDLLITLGVTLGVTLGGVVNLTVDLRVASRLLIFVYGLP
tara:strand:+ start:3586 stop:3771 length:186 start_codon:yes stop_codon:yes gene_type:complete